jgi:tetratricopeptide (TPR) repeat protein
MCKDILNYLQENKEWLFSGIGWGISTLILSGFGYLIKKSIFINQKNINNISEKYLNNVPQYNPKDLIGRNGVLKKIHKKLSNDTRPVCLSDIAGWGKTTIAQTYVNKVVYNRSYHRIAWIKGGSIDDFLSSFNIRVYEKTDGQQDDNMYLNQLLEKLKQHNGNNLIVIDNANDVCKLNKLIECINNSIRWKILITSRCKPDSDIYTIIQFEKLTEKEARILFYNFYKKERNDTTLIEIFKQIDYNPLLIVLLSKVGNRNSRLDLDTISNLLHSESINANQFQLTVDFNGKEIKLLTYVMSIFKEDINNLNEIEVKYLRYFSLLLPIDITIESLMLLFNIEDFQHGNFSDDLNKLAKKGWLISSGNSYKMHSLITNVLRKELDPNEENCRLIFELFNNIIGPNSRYNYSVFLSHLIHVYDTFGFINMTMKCKMANQISKAYRYLANLDDSEKYGLMALQVVINNPNNCDTIQDKIYKNLASINRRIGNLSKAEEYAILAIEIREKRENKKIKELVESYMTLIYIYIKQNKNTEAQSYIDRARRITSTLKSDDNHINYLKFLIFDALGDIQLEKGIYKEAISMYLMAIQYGEQYIPYKKKYIPSIEISLSGTYKLLARCYYNIKNFAESSKFIEKSVEIQKNNYPQEYHSIFLKNTLEWKKRIDIAKKNSIICEYDESNKDYK